VWQRGSVVEPPAVPAPKASETKPSAASLIP